MSRFYSILDSRIVYECDMCGKDCGDHVEMPPRVTGAAKTQHYCHDGYAIWEEAMAAAVA